MKAASVSAEKLKEDLNELSILFVSSVVRFGFNPSLSGQIQALVQAAQHILTAA